MSENLALGVYVTAAVLGGLVLLGIVGVIVDRIFARHEQ